MAPGADAPSDNALAAQPHNTIDPIVIAPSPKTLLRRRGFSGTAVCKYFPEIPVDFQKSQSAFVGLLARSV